MLSAVLATENILSGRNDGSHIRSVNPEQPYHEVK